MAVGLRADFYGRCAEHPGLAAAMAGDQVLLGPHGRTTSSARRSSARPRRRAAGRARRWSTCSSREVAGEPGALPLLAHALRATWERRDGRTLTSTPTARPAGVRAPSPRPPSRSTPALDADDAGPGPAHVPRAHRARRGHRRHPPAGDPGRAHAGRGRRPGRASLLDAMAAARLVTVAEGTVEVAHEALIREWPRLRAWLDEDRDGLRLHRQVADGGRGVGRPRPRAGRALPGPPPGRRRRVGGADRDDASDARGGVPRREPRPSSERGSGRRPAPTGACAACSSASASPSCVAMVAARPSPCRPAATGPPTPATAPTSPASPPCRAASSSASPTSACCWPAAAYDLDDSADTREHAAQRPRGPPAARGPDLRRRLRARGGGLHARRHDAGHADVGRHGHDPVGHRHPRAVAALGHETTSSSTPPSAPTAAGWPCPRST